MKRRYSWGKQKQAAVEHIRSLFKEAAGIFAENKALANRHVTIARKIAMKLKVKIPPEYKRRFCKHCYRYLQPGVNSRVRVRKGKVIISCLECKKFMRVAVR